jgi:hypothetical protein
MFCQPDTRPLRRCVHLTLTGLLRTPSENFRMPLSGSRAAAVLSRDRLNLWHNGGGKIETSFSVLTD